MDEIVMITEEFQKGLLLADLGTPLHITLSTYDIDLTLFMAEFYEPDTVYDIWYWLSTRPLQLPHNVHLHQLNNNHCKFWYIETRDSIRLVITSCNITYSMVHGCFQSYYSLTCKNTHNKAIGKCSRFFQIFGLVLDNELITHIDGRLVYNIPNSYNGIELWYRKQNHLVIDANNANLAYLDDLERTVCVRTDIPPSANTIVCYYRSDHISKNLTLVKSPFTALFHYKLYRSKSQLLVSSNNFSFHHKANYELGIIIHDSPS